MEGEPMDQKKPKYLSLFVMRETKATKVHVNDKLKALKEVKKKIQTHFETTYQRIATKMCISLTETENVLKYI